MKYCTKCQSGEKRQLDRICTKCGGNLINIPVNICKCGFKPKSYHAFCIMCGTKLEPKTDILTKSQIDLEKVMSEGHIDN